MQDKQAQLEKLRTQAAECERLRSLATDPLERDTFERLGRHFTRLANEVQATIERGAASEPKGRPPSGGAAILGRNTQEPFPREDD